jgi:hypothetical protein
MPATDLNRVNHVLPGFWDNNPYRDLSIVRTIRRVERFAAGIEPDFAGNRLAQFSSQHFRITEASFGLTNRSLAPVRSLIQDFRCRCFHLKLLFVFAGIFLLEHHTEARPSTIRYQASLFRAGHTVKEKVLDPDMIVKVFGVPETVNAAGRM